jgi:hypothetical protein
MVDPNPLVNSEGLATLRYVTILGMCAFFSPTSLSACFYFPLLHGALVIFSPLSLWQGRAVLLRLKTKPGP